MKVFVLVDHRVSGYYWRLEDEKVDKGRGPFLSQTLALEDAGEKLGAERRHVPVCTNCECPEQCLATDQCIDAEIERITNLPDEDIRAEHLAGFDGDEELARKDTDMIRATIENAIGRSIKH